MSDLVQLNDGTLTAAYHKPTIDEHIRLYGRSIITVVPTTVNPEAVPFLYTIGNRKISVPELLFVGQVNADLTALVNRVSSALRLRILGDFPDGLRVVTASTPGKHPVKLIRVGFKARRDYMVQATRYWGSDEYPAMQVLLPDRHGLYRGDPGCEEPYASMPVIVDPT